MKKIKFILVILFTMFISSCSTDKDDDQKQSTNEYFNFTYADKVQKVKNWEALKRGDLIEVVGKTEEGIAIDFRFNVYGNLYDSTTYPVSLPSSIPFLRASDNFTANTFTFSLENLNTTDKTVQVKYSGKVYFYYSPDFTSVSGSFRVKYEEMAPIVEGLGTYAKIDGKDWHGLSFSSTITNNMETRIIFMQNDGEYTIGTAFPYSNAKTGTYTFTNNNAINRIYFHKYDVTIHKEIEYDVEGTVTYSTINDVYVAGTFSLTATHPVTKEKIVITNGKFKELFK